MKGSAAALKERKQWAVQREYLKTEADKDLEDRLGHVLESIRKLGEEDEAQRSDQASNWNQERNSRRQLATGRHHVW